MGFDCITVAPDRRLSFYLKFLFSLQHVVSLFASKKQLLKKLVWRYHF